MDKQIKENTQEEIYPSVKIAFEFVLPSYQWMLNRLEAVNNRIQILLAFVMTLTFALIGIALNNRRQLDFSSCWFYLAASLFILLIGAGIVARSWGGIMLSDLGVFYAKWLHLSEWEFKKDMISFAAKQFDWNKSLVNGKANALIGLNILFILEATALIIWIATSK